MKRTFTFLFAALFAFMGVWAQLPVTSTAPADGQWNADTKWYTLKVKGGYVSLHNADGNANLMLNNGTLLENAQSLWCVVGSEADGYQFYNLASGTSEVLGATGTNGGARMTMYDAAGGVSGVTYRFDIKAKEGDDVNVYVKKQGDNNEWWNDRDNYLSYWKSDQAFGNDGSKCIFTEVDLADFVASYKTSVLASLDALGSFVDVADAKAAVVAITATDVNAFAAIDAAIHANMPEAAQCLTFRNGDTDVSSTRYNNYLTANMVTGKGYGTSDFSAGNATWTLKCSGGFSLYNEVNKVYLGAPSTNGALSKVPTVYTFEVIGDDKVELKANGQTLHLNNYSGNFLSNHDNDDSASRWYIETYDYETELAALIAANADKHAAVPALGQYPTAAYNALGEAASCVEAIEAMAAFKASKNSPVFTIDGVISYASGNSIYDAPGKTNAKGNTHYFKPTDNFDKTMWWALDLTENKIDGPKSSVGIYNVGTGAGFWNASTIDITETSEGDATDGIFLFYAGGGDPIHAQDDGDLICRYGDKGANTGSAWKFTYIGSTYELNKLTDEHSAALVNLQVAYDANKELKDVILGAALGQYSGSKEDLVTALDEAEVILAKDIVGLANMEVSAIEAAEAAIVAGAAKITFNVPVDGKYYRILAVKDWNDDARYLGSKNSTATNEERAEFVADADANTIFLFQDGFLKNYATDLYLVSNSKNFLCYNGEQAEGSKIGFYAASNGLAGAYSISFNEDTRWLYCNTGNYTDAGSSCGPQNGYCFNIEEVQEDHLPALKALCDEFTTQAAEFAKLGEGEALSVLLAIKEQWANINTDVQVLAAKVAAEELVLKAEVKEAMDMMEMFQYVIEDYNENYAPAVREAQSLLAQIEEGSEDYEYLAEGLGFFATAAADGLSTASYMLNQRVNELCNIDEAYEIGGEAEWVDITRVEEDWPVIDNPAFETLEYWGISQTVGENTYQRENAYSNHDAERSVLEILPKGENAVVNIEQTGYFESGTTYRLSGKAMHKGATNAVFFVGDNEYTIPEDQYITFGNAADKFWDVYNVVLEFEAQGEMKIGYRCEFENTDAALYVSELKLEKFGLATSTLRKDFNAVFGQASMPGCFSHWQYDEVFKNFTTLYDEYSALLSDVDAINGALWEDMKVLKAKVKKAVEDMQAMHSVITPVVDCVKGEVYWEATSSAENYMKTFDPETEGYKRLDAANTAAKDYSDVRGIADMEQKLEALNKAIAFAAIEVELKETSVEIVGLGETLQLEATVTPEEVEDADKAITWSSSDEDVATVDATGLVTSVANDTVLITATLPNGRTATCEVRVVVDMTSKIVNAAVTENTGWNNGGLTWSAEKLYRGSAEPLDFNQTITLPAGKYKMTAQAAYRYAGSNDKNPTEEEHEYNQIKDGVETHKAKLYAKAASSSYTYVANVQNRWEGRSTTSLSTFNCSSIVVDGVTYYVPNATEAVVDWFEAGKYVNELVFNVQEEGEVKIGITKTSGVSDYTNIGAWTLVRVSDAEAEPNDMTSMVGTSKEAWHTGGGPVSIDGISMPEHYTEKPGLLGYMLWQEVKGLKNGVYTVELWANARYTPGRGFDTPAVDGQNDCTFLFANNIEHSIPVVYNSDATNNTSHVLENVVVLDGTLKMGMTKKAAGSNWHSIQIKKLTYCGAGEDVVLTYVKAGLQTALEAANAVSPTSTELAAALGVAQGVYDTSEDVEAIRTATDDLKVATRTAIFGNASEDNPVLTDLVVNGKFDEGVTTPWVSTTGAGNQALAFNQEGDFDGFFFENWNSTNYKGKIYQTIENIPNGLYELSICAFVESFDATAQYVYANADKAALSAAAPTAYTVRTIVVDNKIEIGLEQTAEVNRWMGIDNVSLRYFGSLESVGIDCVESVEAAPVIYDLAGRRVEKAVKGIYIVNGKKVVIK